MESSNWKEKFGELNLHGKIVGDGCVDWSHDHQLVLATNKKVLVCDMSNLVSATKSEEIGFMIESVPVITEKEQYLSDSPKFLTEFEAACSQTSNTKAIPNYEVYEYFLDPALYQGKLNEFKGYRSVKFSHPQCTSTTGTELLAVLSLDYSLGVYHKVSAGLHSKWLPLCNLSSSLTNYLKLHSNSFPNHQLDENASEFEILRDQKYCASINNIAWSDAYDVMNERFCILAASTLNGFIVMWKFNMNDDKEFNPEIIAVFASDWVNVAQIAWLQDPSDSFVEKDKAISLAISSNEGQIRCRRLSMPHTFDWLNCMKVNLWEENDKLAPRKIHWINHQGKSLLIASKSHVLVAWVLSANLEILSEFILQDVHCMPITCLNLFESNGKLQCFSGSSDGVLALIDIATTPQLELNVKELLQSSTDFGSYRVISPATLHETTLSPNKAFMVMLTSRPHVRLSVQVENEASVFMKRLLSPEQAAERLLQIALTEEDESLYKYLDLIEITRQYYSMKRKFHPILEDFLAQTDIKCEYDIQKLQFRWYLLKLKSKAVKCSRRTSLVDEMRPQHFEEERECKLVEEVLTVRQMTKALATWFYRSADHADSSLPVVPLLKLLATKEEFLNHKDQELLRNMRNLPAVANLPVQQTCVFTGLPSEISSDCRSASSIDGSSWPLCCLTFNLLQGYEKRKCELSGLYAAFPDKDNPRWLNELLSSSCIFSGAPLRRYIN